VRDAAGAAKTNDEEAEAVVHRADLSEIRFADVDLRSRQLGGRFGR